MMTNREILKIAMAQSATDLCATPEDFEKSENVIVTSRENEGARRYLNLPIPVSSCHTGETWWHRCRPNFARLQRIT